MKMKEFHITEVISVIIGKMVSISHMDGVHALLEFMCGEPIYTQQIPRAIRECAPYLLKQFPMLEGENAEEITQDTLEDWAAAMCQRYGERLPVKPLPVGARFRIDPISELEAMKNPVKH